MLTLGYNFWTEWEFQEKVDFDGINKLIIVYPHVTTLDIREDVWSAWVRWHDMQDRGYDRFLLAMDRSGLETIPNGQTGDYYFLKNGWKLLVNLSKVAITGVMYSRDFSSPYFTPNEVVQFPAQVSSVVNAVTLTQNVVTGDISDVPTITEIEAVIPTGDITNIKDLLEADEEYTITTAIKKHKDTKAVLISKNVTGGSIPSTITISE